MLNHLGFPVIQSYPVPQNISDSIKTQLKNWGIETPISYSENTYIGEPPLSYEPDRLDPDIEINFQKMTQEILGPELDLLDGFWEFYQLNPLPTMPEQILLESGWTKYNPDGSTEKVDYIDEPIFVFDTETFVLGGNFPIIATAIGKSAIYVWIAKEFITDLPVEEWDQHKLVPLSNPLEPDSKVFIAHNAGFDLARCREAYRLRQSKPKQDLYFFDTLSAHIATSGLGAQQRWMYILKDKDPENLTPEEKQKLKFKPQWLSEGSMNSLVHCYNFHVADSASFFETNTVRMEKEDKKIRNVFVITKTMSDFVKMGNSRFNLLEYAVKDSLYTTELFLKLWPKYKSVTPSPISRAAHLILSTGRVPMAKDLDNWIQHCESLLEADEQFVHQLVTEEAHRLYDQWLNSDQLFNPESDPWYVQLDWSNVNKGRGKSAKSYPKWFLPFLKPDNLFGTKAVITHLLMKLRYNGQPCVRDNALGWGYYDLQGNFIQIPHATGKPLNVGCLLSKNYISQMEDGTLSGDHPKAQEVFNVAIRDSFWVSTRSRIIERLRGTITNPYNSNDEINLMVPQIVPHGTVTRRTTENIFNVMTSPKPNKIGTEIRTKIIAPEGYRLVTADCDSEELNLASLLADRFHSGYFGSSPMTFNIVAGDKQDNTDAHSAFAYRLFLEQKGFVYNKSEKKWYRHQN